MHFKVDRMGKDSRDVYSQKVVSNVVAASEDHCESEKHTRHERVCLNVHNN